jgi:hypothetical protein
MEITLIFNLNKSFELMVDSSRKKELIMKLLRMFPKVVAIKETLMFKVDMKSIV